MASIRGGNKLESVLNGIARKLKRADSVSIGFLSGATYPDGTPVAMVAAILEYGAPRAGIPPRPFFRNMIAEKQDEWGPAIGALLVANDFDAKVTLSLTGEAIAGQLRESILKTNYPPLKPATIRAKGFSKPLVDTGQMLNSVGYEVTTK